MPRPTSEQRAVASLDTPTLNAAWKQKRNDSAVLIWQLNANKMSLVSGYAATYDLSTSGGGQLPVTSGFYGDTSAFYSNTWNDCNYLHLNHYGEIDSGGTVAPISGGLIIIIQFERWVRLISLLL